MFQACNACQEPRSYFWMFLFWFVPDPLRLNITYINILYKTLERIEGGHPSKTRWIPSDENFEAVQLTARWVRVAKTSTGVSPHVISSQMGFKCLFGASGGCC